MSHAEKLQTAAPRRIARIFRGMPTEDGAGVKLTRLVGTPGLQQVDPILMLDTFRSDKADDYIAGFPEHPHRGFETVSYMIEGSIRHRDNHGGEGLVSDGGVQWMTAGRGVAHSEMPAQTGGRLFGFQLWINLPAAEKMREPWYRDIPASEIPRVALSGGGEVRLIAGEWNGVTGPGPARKTEPFFADVGLAAGAAVDVPLPQGHGGLIYLYDGEASVAGEQIPTGGIAVLTDGASLQVTAGADHEARFLVIGGKPLREPIAKYGPFVMNTADEIHRAMQDYQEGRF